MAESVDLAGMGASTTELIAHQAGELSLVEELSATADTFGGRVHVEWDPAALPCTEPPGWFVLLLAAKPPGAEAAPRSARKLATALVKEAVA
jgi:hypothetical protein